MMERAEVIMTLVGMAGTFIVTLAVFMWWISAKFFGLKMSFDKGLFHLSADITSKMTEMHNQNVARFHNLDNRLTVLERKRG